MTIEETVIKITGLSKSFNNTHILNNLDLEVKKGETFVLLGGSGTGKSVLIKNIMGIIIPDSGSIYINGLDITSLSQAQRIKSDINMGMLFQGSALFDSLSVFENVIFYQMIHNKISKSDAKALAAHTLNLVGLDDTILNKYPSELSGGMQKRVALARLIIQSPEILFFDEPTTGLDPVLSEVINNLIIKTIQYLKATSIVITHDMHSARKIASTIGLLHTGSIIWQGSPTEIDTCDNKIVHNFIRGISH